MCFNAKGRYPKIATEDIIVYKYSKRNSVEKDIFRSFHRTLFIYQRGEENEEITISPSCHGYVINEGYHSYIKKPNRWRGERRGKFKIPKGATYYENNTERVSSQLIYLGRVWW